MCFYRFGPSKSGFCVVTPTRVQTVWENIQHTSHVPVNSKIQENTQVPCSTYFGPYNGFPCRHSGAKNVLFKYWNPVGSIHRRPGPQGPPQSREGTGGTLRFPHSPPSGIIRIRGSVMSGGNLPYTFNPQPQILDPISPTSGPTPNSPP